MNNSGEREAERLRIIMQSFLNVSPDMQLRDAIPAIFETEKQTAELERVAQLGEAPARPREFELPNFQRETIAMWIDLTPLVADMIRTGAKIQAIREVRIGVVCGGSAPSLYEAKEGVEYWARKLTTGAAPVGSTSPSAISDWIAQSAQGDIRELLRDCMRIQAIKEVRSRYPHGAGLKEAKEGVLEWEKMYL